jgi:hypothetical protein
MLRWLATLQAALVAPLPLVPFVAALFSVAGFLAPAELVAGTRPLTVAGLTVAPALVDLLLAWAVLALIWLLLGYTSAARASSSSYASLRAHLDDIDVRYASCCGLGADAARRPACQLVDMHRRAIAERIDRPGPAWVLGVGYLALWSRVYRAEEALLLVDDRDRVISHGLYNVLSLTGSKVENADALVCRSGHVLALLGRGTATDEVPYPPSDEGGARQDLATMLRAVHDYRHHRWAGLISARNYLVAVVGLTSLTVYVLLWLAIAMGSQRDTIGVVCAYYLIGAVIGLMNQLHSGADSGKVPAVDDYGLSLVRLIVTPLLSGLAAVGGVLIVAMLSLTQTGSIGTADAQPLVRFLDLATHPLNVLVAATFGLAPKQLMDRLRQQTDEYKEDLQKSRPVDGRPPDQVGQPKG